MTASVATRAQDQKLTPREVQQARLFLQQTQNAVIGATKLLSEAQWKFRPAPDKWSIAEILDHIVIVQERVLGPVLDQLANAPAPPVDRDCDLIDAIVINQFPTRLAKFPAPESVRPLDHFNGAEALNRMSMNYARMSHCLESTPGLRQHALEAAPLKAISMGAYDVMDGYQWILAAAAHTERHAKQILEVIADCGFPA